MLESRGYQGLLVDGNSYAPVSPCFRDLTALKYDIQTSALKSFSADLSNTIMSVMVDPLYYVLSEAP